MKETEICRVFSFSRAYNKAIGCGKGHDEALGAGIHADFSTRKSIIPDEKSLVGVKGSDSLVTLTHFGLDCAKNIPQSVLGSPYEAEAIETIEKWAPRTTSSIFQNRKEGTFSKGELIALADESYGWGGGWGGHCVLGYEQVLKDGIDGVRDHVSACAQDRWSDWDYGVLRVCEGISEFIDGYGQEALSRSEAVRNVEQKAQLECIAEVCAHVSHSGAQNFMEAVQLFWFIHVLDETDSPGRIDQFLFPYFMMISDNPARRRAKAWPILNELWKKFIENRTWNVCLGGQTSDGDDAANELTYIFLDLQEEYGREAPNLSVRIFEGSKPELLSRCTKIIGKGSGQPTLYNDQVMVPALENLGLPIEHARDYALNGCAQVDIQGKSHMGLEDGEISLIKCLELALHQGRSPLTGQETGGSTKPLESIQDFPELLCETKKQIDYAVSLFVRASNLFQQVQADTCPQLFRSLFVSGCVESGLDLKRGGPLYNHGQFQTEGIANCGDALYSIKTLVFDEKRHTLKEFVEILDRNWDEHLDLKTIIKNRLPKFGNACVEVDRITAEILDHYFTALSRHMTWRGGTYSGGVVVYNRAYRYGKGLAASADGRSAGEPVADSIGPSQGNDTHGPTAMLSSVAKLPFRKATCGACLNVKFLPSVFENEKGASAVASLFSTYFDLGGQQLQVNVVDHKTLLAAKADPDSYRSLVVRVGGYSDLFVNLSSEYQDDIISRTAHAL